MICDLALKALSALSAAPSATTAPSGVLEHLSFTALHAPTLLPHRCQRCFLRTLIFPSLRLPSQTHILFSQTHTVLRFSTSTHTTSLLRRTMLHTTAASARCEHLLLSQGSVLFNRPSKFNCLTEPFKNAILSAFLRHTVLPSCANPH